jgi:coproporphyrinogen III oxidase
VIERGAVQFSHTVGTNLPPTATTRRPELTGQSFEAVSVSLILHPRNPFAPTTHANFRVFATDGNGGPAAVWFGGGFDLTPTYGFVEDAMHWHRTARDACAPHGAEVYPEAKAACDAYFFLPHRGETRGVGGVFFDDLEDGGFEGAFALIRSVGDAFLPAYLPILRRRKDTPFTPHHRDFQLYRRGRYVEFNLAYDRGTRFGLQAGARTESILASLPPVVHWRYDFKAPPESAEATLVADFMRPRDWLGEYPNAPLYPSTEEPSV